MLTFKLAVRNVFLWRRCYLGIPLGSSKLWERGISKKYQPFGTFCIKFARSMSFCSALGVVFGKFPPSQCFLCISDQLRRLVRIYFFSYGKSGVISQSLKQSLKSIHYKRTFDVFCPQKKPFFISLLLFYNMERDLPHIFG